MTLGDRLRACGLDPTAITAHRIALHTSDRDDAYRLTADLVRTDHALVYERLQDGPVFGQAALVAAFVDEGDAPARFAGLRRLVARRPGLAPGDIIYDPDIAHLLHNFISRADNPTFYDAVDDGRGADLQGCLLQWPHGSPDVRRADDPDLTIAGGSA